MSKITRILIIVLIGLNIVFAAWYILHNDLLFHTDIARDFLLIEDIAYNKHITLIGPRSGGISGVFHGPLWLYLNLPAFLLGQGNPVYVGWFWLILYLFFLAITYKIAQKVFDNKTALISTLLLSIITAVSVKNLFNPFGAVMMAPVYWYCLWQYFKTVRFKYLILSFFVLGLIIQFQIAFGGPILLLTLPLLGVFLYKKKKLIHFSALLIILIPLSTYVLFELKHNFLQLRSVVGSVSAAKSPGDQIWTVYLVERIKGFFISGLKLQPIGNLLFDMPITFLFIFLFLRIWKNKKLKNRIFYLLFFYYYIGFWLLTFLFRGVIWSYYYWPFLPLIVIILVSSYKQINRIVYYGLIFYILILNYFVQIDSLIKSNKQIGKDGGSWQFNFQLTKKIFTDSSGNFGYYIYTPDLFGYSTRYAFNYAQTLFRNKTATPFQKRPVSYVVMAPPPDDKPYLNGEWWLKNQVKIDKKPNKIIEY